MKKIQNKPIAPGMVMHFDGHDLFIIVDGVKVSKRGRPNTPEARPWIALDPGSRLMAIGEMEIKNDTTA